MTDKKLSDSEIIKALECCSVEGHFVCNECPAWVESRCIAKNKYILDLINRLQAKFIKEQNKNSKLRNERNHLQAENERLEVENQSLRGAANSLKMHYEEAQAEIKGLNAKNMLTMSERNAFRTSFYEVSKQQKTTKSEAVKECLAKVKNYIKTHCNPYGKPDFDYDTSIKILNFIDKLAKEMVGDDNA